MEIASFKIDHLRLKSGLYVSRKDMAGYTTVTTFDIRMKKPYDDDVMDTGAIHAIEHIGATFLRNDQLWKDKVIYFGPMGCRTGFYLIMVGDLSIENILPLITRTFQYIADFEGDIPGSSPIECGYCVDMDLSGAKHHAKLYSELLANARKYNFNYPKPKEKKNN